MRDLSQSLPMLLLQAREATMACFRPVLSEHGLTEQQWRVLRVLHETDDIEITELSRQTIMLQPSLTGVVKRLERDGLVNRRKDRADARKTCISISARGRALYNKIAPQIEQQYSRLQKRFSADDWQGLYDSLQQLVTINNESTPGN